MSGRAVSDPSPVQSYRSVVRRAVHAVLVLAGWVVFALLWWRVLDRPGAAGDVRDVLVKLGILTLVVGLLTWAWIVHNVALARRRGGRNQVTVLQRPNDDLLGRRLEVAPEAQTASYVVVRVDGSVKHFVTGDRAGV